RARLPSALSHKPVLCAGGLKTYKRPQSFVSGLEPPPCGWTRRQKEQPCADTRRSTSELVVLRIEFGLPNLVLKPDIANISLRHLYEIKPLTQLAEAQSKLSLYLGIFNTAGVPMTPGSQTEPGTTGVLPAPDGYYMYECPLPGIILYQYYRGQY